jgi:tetratricopeptide (TPR) repeat protein
VRSWLAALVMALGCGIAPSQTKQSNGTSTDPFQQGLISLQENHPEAALEAFNLAETKMPNDARVHNFRGIALTSLGRTDEASSEYLRALALDPKLQSAYRNLGFLEWKAHNSGSARGHLEQALVLDANDEFSRYYLARIEIEGQRYEKVEQLFKAMVHRAWAELDLSLSYLYAGQYQEAIRTAQPVCDRAVKSSSPYLASALSIVGIAESRERHKEKSIAALRQAAVLAPQQEEHWLNLSRELMDNSQFADALTYVQEGLRSNPKSYALRLRLGAAYFSSGKYDEAERAFRELVAAGDPLPMSYIGLAQVLLHTGRATEASTELAAAEEKLGSQFLLVYFRGLALARAGRRAEALAAFKQAVQIDPNSAEAHLGLGKIALLLGDVLQAVKELQKVRELDPKNVPAGRLLGQAYARLGDRENALKFATSTPDNEAEPRTNLVGDFILPDWQQPALP